ncbi:transposase [Streptomyces griseoluteus]|uniref:transposase n=1 Tax=Streptomyces griseoluteus TaxID=29306 RepID=UPI0036AB5B26
MVPRTEVNRQQGGGGSSRRCSGRPGPRSTGASPGGAENGSGPGSTGSSSTNSELAESWTGRGVRSTQSASGQQKRATNRTESDRPRQERSENPPAHRPERPVTGHLQRQHARQPRRETARTRHPAHPLQRGPRRRRPAKLHADKGYDYDHLRRGLRKRGIRHRIARKGIESSTQLGRHRWVVERAVAWLAGCRRLHRRYEHKAEHFLAFVGTAAALIGYRRLAR